MIDTCWSSYLVQTEDMQAIEAVALDTLPITVSYVHFTDSVSNGFARTSTCGPISYSLGASDYEFVTIMSDEIGFSITVDTIDFSGSGLFTFTVEAKLDNYYPTVPVLSVEFTVEVEPASVWTPPLEWQ